MRFTFVMSILALTALYGCGTMSTSEHMPPANDSTVEQVRAQAAVVQSLQRQVRERDRRIAELTFQLEALKTIDRDAELRRQQGRFLSARDR